MMNLEEEHAEGGRPAQRGSKVTRERVGLLVLTVLLAAAAIVIYRISFDHMWTKRQLHTLREDLPKWETLRDQCYYFSTIPLTWHESRRLCRYHGADLVRIDSWDEQTFLMNRLKEKMADAEDTFWIGLTDSETEGKWLWVDGSALDPSLRFWSSGEPDNWSDCDPRGEDCVTMGGEAGEKDRKLWFDSACEKFHRGICEKKQEGQKCV